jgi:hypothetical protein
MDAWAEADAWFPTDGGAYFLYRIAALIAKEEDTIPCERRRLFEAAEAGQRLDGESC